jgi:LacI family transcriptional regulator
VRARVTASMQALGYEPHALAQSLRTGHTQTVGYIVYDISNFLFSTIALGIDDRLQTAGYTMLLTNSRGDPLHEAQLLKLMQRRRVDALILALSDEGHIETRRALQSLKIPLVLLDREMAGLAADQVLTDSPHGVTQAVEHLYGLGHRRIGLLTGTANIRPGRVTRQAFEACVARLGLPHDARLIKGEILGEDDTVAALATLLALDDPPTAIIAATVQASVGALRFVRERELAVPEQLSLIVYDATDAAALAQPGFAVIARDVYSIGWQAAQLLIDRIAQPDAPPRTVFVPTELIVRGSTAPPLS